MSKYYAPSSSGFYDDSIHLTMPADAKPITDQQWHELIDGQTQGKRIGSSTAGAPVLIDVPQTTRTDLTAAALSNARAMRQPIINMLDGMQASALAKADSVRAKAIEVAKQGLRDITKIDLASSSNAVQMKAVIAAQLKVLSDALPVDARLAFGV